MPPAAAAALCRRVTTTSVIIRASPPPSGLPTGSAYASWSPTSAVGHGPGTELVLEPVQRHARCGRVRRDRWSRTAASRSRSGGSGTEQVPCCPDTPRCGRTSATAIAESIAEQNHFSPWTRHEPSAAGMASRGGPADIGAALRLGHPLATGDGHAPGRSRAAAAATASRTDESTSERESRAAAPSAIATGQVNVADSGP